MVNVNSNQFSSNPTSKCVRVCSEMSDWRTHSIIVRRKTRDNIIQQNVNDAWNTKIMYIMFIELRPNSIGVYPILFRLSLYRYRDHSNVCAGDIRTRREKGHSQWYEHWSFSGASNFPRKMALLNTASFHRLIHLFLTVSCHQRCLHVICGSTSNFYTMKWFTDERSHRTLPVSLY